MIVTHIIGIPIEESVLQLAPIGAATVATAAVVIRFTLSRVARAFRRPKAE